MTDSDTGRRLANINQTLELIAFLLAVVVVQQGNLGVIVGGATILLLIASVVERRLGLSEN